MTDHSQGSILNELLFPPRQYLELFVTVLVPWLALLCLNLRIYLAVRLRTFRGRARNSSVRQKRETNLAIILITIVLVFLFCHSLKLILAFYKVKIFQSPLYIIYDIILLVLPRFM